MEYNKISKVSNECSDIEKFIESLDNIKNHFPKANNPAIMVTIAYNVGSSASINVSDETDMEKILDLMISNYKLILKEKTIYLKRLIEILGQ